MPVDTSAVVSRNERKKVCISEEPANQNRPIVPDNIAAS